MRREVYEQTGVRLGPARLFASSAVRVLGSPPSGYRHPCPDSYMVYYRAPAAALDPFAPTAESAERGFLAPEALCGTRWYARSPGLYRSSAGRGARRPGLGAVPAARRLRIVAAAYHLPEHEAAYARIEREGKTSWDYLRGGAGFDEFSSRAFLERVLPRLGLDPGAGATTSWSTRTACSRS